MEKLIVKNFGPVTSLDITLKKFNVFIGEQGVGKSTITKLLSCCQDFFLYYLISHDKDRKEIDLIFKAHGILDFFKEDSFFEYKQFPDEPGFPYSSITLTYKDNQFALSFEGLENDKVKNIIASMVGKSISDFINLSGDSNEEQVKEELNNLFEKNSKLLFSYLRTSFYCPAERGIAAILSNSITSMLVGDIPLPRMLLEFMSFFEKARNEYQKFEIPFLNIEYKYQNGKNVIENENFSINLEFASSGIQSIVPLLMVIQYCLDKRYFERITVEEPELNLFPINQRHLLNLLVNKTNKLNIGSLNLTTHSPYTLSILNVMILAGVIREKFPEREDTIKAYIESGTIINPDEISAYSLSQFDDVYCKSIINTTTGMIDANYLDSVSAEISNDFQELYKTYISLLKGAKE